MNQIAVSAENIPGVNSWSLKEIIQACVEGFRRTFGWSTIGDLLQTEAIDPKLAQNLKGLSSYEPITVVTLEPLSEAPNPKARLKLGMRVEWDEQLIPTSHEVQQRFGSGPFQVISVTTYDDRLQSLFLVDDKPEDDDDLFIFYDPPVRMQRTVVAIDKLGAVIIAPAYCFIPLPKKSLRGEGT